MRIAFYAPLKPPHHPTPSGDRLMANLLIRALRMAGHDVFLASEIRTFSPHAAPERYRELESASRSEAEALIARWRDTAAAGRPDCWVTYHPFYKSPDWIGPAVAHALAIPYVTVEASYARKRDGGPWQAWQAQVVRAVRQARVNVCFTERDREGLDMLGAPLGRTVMLPPFLDAPPLPPQREPSSAKPPGVARLVTVAMMRPGNKLASYLSLVQALHRLDDLRWQLTIIGDGAARDEVLAAFAGFSSERIRWLGRLDAAAVAAELAAAELFLWPGVREPFGLVFLEAQAMGLPVVGQDDGGVAAVAKPEVTGFLTPPGDVDAFAAAARRLIEDRGLRERMGKAALHFARGERTVAAAAGILGEALRPLAPRPAARVASSSCGPAGGWQLLEQELTRWRDARRTVTLWLRDDDATAVTPALERLDEITGRSAIPCLLAVVPADATPMLAVWLDGRSRFEAGAHGWAHIDHAGPGAKKQEYPATRDRRTTLRELAQSHARMTGLFGPRYCPIFVPPWNRIAPDIAAQLPVAGFLALSTFGRRSRFAGTPPLPEINTHLDIIDWHGSRGGHDPARLAGALARELQEQWAEAAPYVGLLTHHLVHDDQAWSFLEDLFALTAEHPAVRWAPVSELLGAQMAP
jgi:glycosyltransferase involved in cell wall biosynthesis